MSIIIKYTSVKIKKTIFKGGESFLVFDFGARLKDLRDAKGLSQTQVAKLMGLSKTTISKYENNVTLPSIDLLKGFAVFYRVTTDYLLGLDDRKAIVISAKDSKDAEFLRKTFEFMQNEINKSREQE